MRNIITGRVLKIFAAMIALGYAYIALKNNEKFVLSTFAESLERYRPKKGRKHLAAVVSYLNKKTPEGKTDIDHAIGAYRKLIKHRSLIIIISDFLYNPSSLRRALYQFKDQAQRCVRQPTDDLPISLILQLNNEYR